MNTWKIPIVKVIRYRNLAATEVLNNDKMRCNNHDCTDCVLLTKNLSRNICILDSNEFQPESKNLINEILNTAACDNSDEQYIKLDGSTCKNFGLLNTNELNRRIHHRCCNSRKNKVDPARIVSADIQRREFSLLEMNWPVSQKMSDWLSEKNNSYPIHLWWLRSGIHRTMKR